MKVLPRSMAPGRDRRVVARYRKTLTDAHARVAKGVFELFESPLQRFRISPALGSRYISPVPPRLPSTNPGDAGRSL